MTIAGYLIGSWNLCYLDTADHALWRKNPAAFDANAYSTWRANFGGLLKHFYRDAA